MPNKALICDKSQDILIRYLTENDFLLMLKWLTDKRILEFYGGRNIHYTIESLTEHYSRKFENGFRVIIEYREIPLGYGQIYRLKGKLFSEYDYPDSGKIVYDMDQFIGEPECWNKGIGTCFLKLIANYMKKQKAAEIILLDPRKSNHRAIKSYEKSGFKIIKSLPKHEMFEGRAEDCWLMEKVL